MFIMGQGTDYYSLAMFWILEGHMIVQRPRSKAKASIIKQPKYIVLYYHCLVLPYYKV